MVDAPYLAKEFEDEFDQMDFIRLANYRAYIKAYDRRHAIQTLQRHDSRSEEWLRTNGVKLFNPFPPSS
jgi:hypothetical protein